MADTLIRRGNVTTDRCRGKAMRRQNSHPQAEETSLGRIPPCRHLDLGLPASRAIRQLTSAVSHLVCGPPLWLHPPVPSVSHPLSHSACRAPLGLILASGAGAPHPGPGQGLEAAEVPPPACRGARTAGRQEVPGGSMASRALPPWASCVHTQQVLTSAIPGFTSHLAGAQRERESTKS